MMDRRTFIRTTAGALVVMLPNATRAQQEAKVWRVGTLLVRVAGPAGIPGGLRQALPTLGYVDGRNVAFVDRSADGMVERLPKLSAELVGLRMT